MSKPKERSWRKWIHGDVESGIIKINRREVIGRMRFTLEEAWENAVASFCRGEESGERDEDFAKLLDDILDLTDEYVEKYPPKIDVEKDSPF